MDNLTFFEKCVAVVDKYGSWKVFQSIFYVGLFLFVVFYIPAITKYTVEKTTIESIETADKNKEEVHIKNIEYRKKIQPQISLMLQDLNKECGSERSFIVELHNGSSNLSKLPFLHGSVTYEETTKGVESISEEYQNLSLSRFKLSTYLHDNFSFMGSVDDVAKIDSKFASKLASNDVKFIAIISLHNGINEWGYLGIIYTNENEMCDKATIMSKLSIVAQNSTKLLQINE